MSPPHLERQNLLDRLDDCAQLSHVILWFEGRLMRLFLCACCIYIIHNVLTEGHCMTGSPSGDMQSNGWITFAAILHHIVFTVHCIFLPSPVVLNALTNIEAVYFTGLCSSLYVHFRTSAEDCTQTHIHSSVSLSVFRAQSERNPWVVLTSALLTRCQGSEVKLDLGQQVVTMVRSLYNGKHKLAAQVNTPWITVGLLVLSFLSCSKWIKSASTITISRIYNRSDWLNR